MNDRFKFRVYNKRLQKMYDVRSMSEYQGSIVRIEVDDYNNETKEYRRLIFDDYCKIIDACILMQCTGLKDRNGKLIYEGDIVTIFHSEEYKGVIKYNQDWVSFWIDGKGIAYNALNTIRHDYFIKLGDIYTTPELLEGKE